MPWGAAGAPRLPEVNGNGGLGRFVFCVFFCLVLFCFGRFVLFVCLFGCFFLLFLFFSFCVLFCCLFI